MIEFDEMGQAGVLARVREVADNGRLLYLELRNGQTATAHRDEPFDIPVRSVVLLRQADNQMDIVPESLWPEETWIGIVRIKLHDVTVLNTEGRWRFVPTVNEPEYNVGNTVEAKETLGVVRVLSKDPIRYIDLPTLDDDIISKFKTPEGSQRLTFSDFGGLTDVVERARELIETRLKHKDKLAKIGAPPIRGVLFTGPPGTGKTMLAQIIANEAGSAFFVISGPEIFSKWYGQSEELLRLLFQQASKETSAIIFFDEIDSVASQREESAHEVSRRVVAQLLTLMDGFSSDDNVVVIAATNRPQDIDEALRRPGRFDWELRFPLPSLADRMAILELAERRYATFGSLPHAWVANKSDGWSGAELTAIWSEAALFAVDDEREVIMTEDYLAGYDRVAAQRARIVSGTAPVSRT